MKQQIPNSRPSVLELITLMNYTTADTVESYFNGGGGGGGDFAW